MLCLNIKIMIIKLFIGSSDSIQLFIFQHKSGKIQTNLNQIQKRYKYSQKIIFNKQNSSYPEKAYPIYSQQYHQMQTESPVQQQNTVQSFKLFCHLISSDQKDLETHLVDVEKNLTLQECGIILSDKLKKPMNNLQFKTNPTAQFVDLATQINKLIQKDDADLFVFYEEIKPILKQKQKQVLYETISKYSFLDQKKNVKVYIPLEGIGKVSQENIHSRFLDRSIQIKIFGYKGKNWIFAVPKTQCQVFIKQSSVVKKDDKLIIKIGKIAEGDNWFSLHKTRCVGQKQLD